MRKQMLIILTFGLFAATCIAQDESKWSGSWVADLKPQYFGSTVAATFADQVLVQQNLSLNRKLSQTLTLNTNVWNSKGFSDSFQTFADETEVNIGVTKQTGKFTVSALGQINFLNPKAGTDAVELVFNISRQFARGKIRLLRILHWKNTG
jgi:hypothetical protein